MEKRLFIVGLLSVLALSACPSQAQSVELTMDIFTSTALSQSITTLNNNAVMLAYRNSEAEKRGGSVATAKRQVNLAYTSTPALRQQTVQNLARQLRGKNAAAGQSIANAFGPGKTDYNQLLGQMV